MIAIVTGASSGIGREFVRQLDAGGEVDGFWLIARRRERLEELAATLAHPCRILSADLSTDGGLTAVEQALLAERPEVRVFVSGAGYGRFGNALELSAADTAGMIDLNVRAAVLLTRMILPYMMRGGYIIQLGSGSCFTPLPNFAVYAAGKSFILHYSKALAREVRPRGITVTCFCPGWVDTEFLGLATWDESVSGPRKTAFRPMLRADRVVRKALRDARRGRVMSVTNWYTKLQHLLFKLLPDGILTSIWMRMQKPMPENDEKDRENTQGDTQ